MLAALAAAGVAAVVTFLVRNPSARPFTATGVLDVFSVLDRSSVPLPPGPAGVDEPLGLPRRGEMALARAERLRAGGRLHDALDALDAVRLTDKERADADRLRAEIQRQLITRTP